MLDKLLALATQYAPAVTEAGLQAVRVDGYSTLVGSSVGFVLSSALGYGSWRGIKWGMKNDDEGACILGMVGIVVAAAGIVITVLGLTDPWLWTMLNHPEIYIAKKVMHL